MNTTIALNKIGIMFNENRNINRNVLAVSLVMSLQLVLMVAILVGNTLVIVTLYKIKALRDITGIFVGNLAVADLIIGLTLPYEMMFFVFPSLARNKNACLSRFSMVCFSCNASLYSLVCTVVDRYIAIVYPPRYTDILTRYTAYKMVTLIWMIDLTVTILPTGHLLAKPSS